MKRFPLRVRTSAHYSSSPRAACRTTAAGTSHVARHRGFRLSCIPNRFKLDGDLHELLPGQKTIERNFSYLPQNVLGRMVARQTGFYWGTSGRTSEPVAVGAIGPGAQLFHGYQDNTDFGRHLDTG